MKPATEILLSAAFVLTPKENFVQGAYARTATGARIDRPEAGHEHAVQWCVVAAIDNAAYALGFEGQGLLDAQSAFLQHARDVDQKQNSSAEDFNNAHTHAEVLKALYRAAELAEAS